MATQQINPEGMPAPTGYSYVVSAEARQMVFVSGQVAIDSEGKVVGEGDLERQGEQVFENLRTCLAAAGATFGDVVKMTTYVVNFDAARDRPVINALRQRYLPADRRPTSTLVGVSALAVPSLLIEIEMIAALD
jgi:enamine deaminase RidA (YjgF/YER057c/UK114 family)